MVIFSNHDLPRCTCVSGKQFWGLPSKIGPDTKLEEKKRLNLFVQQYGFLEIGAKFTSQVIPHPSFLYGWSIWNPWDLLGPQPEVSATFRCNWNGCRSWRLGFGSCTLWWCQQVAIENGPVETTWNHRKMVVEWDSMRCTDIVIENGPVEMTWVLPWK